MPVEAGTRLGSDPFIAIRALNAQKFRGTFRNSGGNPLSLLFSSLFHSTSDADQKNSEPTAPTQHPDRHMEFHRSVISRVSVALLLSSCLQAQQAALTLSAAAKPDGAGTIRVTTNLVVVPVLVMDRFDQFITGLRKDDFELYDNRVRQDIRYISS